MELSSRQRSLRDGLPTYFTGKPCKNGHLAPRQAVNRHCLDCVKLWNRQLWDLDRDERLFDNRRRYYRNHERYKEINRNYHQNNKEKIKALNALGTKRLRTQAPPWSNLNAIRKFYVECPNGYHVDHIIPLKGRIVSGLHIPDNLQYLPALENLRKSNSFP